MDKDFRPQSGSKHDEIFTADRSICVLKWLGNTTICLLFRMNIAAENEPHPQYGHRSFCRFIPSFDAVEYCMSAWGLSPARLNPNMCNYFWNYRATKSTLVTFQISFNLPIGYPIHLPFPNLCHWKCTMLQLFLLFYLFWGCKVACPVFIKEDISSVLRVLALCLQTISSYTDCWVLEFSSASLLLGKLIVTP